MPLFGKKKKKKRSRRSPLVSEIKEYAKWTKEDEKLKSEGTRKVRIYNNASSDIFSVSLALAGIGKTELKEEFYIPHLPPGEEFEEPYELEKEKIPLKLNEHIKKEVEGIAFPARQETPITFTIEAENTSDVPLSEVRITRIFPEEIDVKRKKITSNKGRTKKVSNGIALSLEKLEVNESVKLEVPCVFRSKKSETVQLGRIKATFKPEKPTSGVEVANIEGTAPVFQDLHKKEKEEVFSWDVLWEIKNKNDFPLTCSGSINFQSMPGIVEEEEKLVVEGNTLLLKPVVIEGNESRSMGPFTIESEKLPPYEARVEGRARGNVTYALKGEYEEVRPSAPILDGQLIGKPLEIDHAPEFADFLGENMIMDVEEADLCFSNSLENSGSARVGWVRFREGISKGFANPEDVTCHVRGEKVEEDDYSFRIEPEDAGRKQERELIVDIENMEPYGGGLEKNERVSIKYCTKAVSPRQEAVRFPSTVEFSTEKGNLTRTLLLAEELGEKNVPRVSIKRGRRAFRVTRDIETIEKDHFKITQKIKNESEIPIPDYHFQTTIPDEFEVLEGSREPQVEEKDEKKICTWKIEETISPDETTEVWFSVKGHGDYHIEELFTFLGGEEKPEEGIKAERDEEGRYV